MKTFKYTDEQLQAIYDGDIDARNTFYFDNLDIITRMAQTAIEREKHPSVTVEDLIQGAYVDMDYFCQGPNKRVQNNLDIATFMRWSFHLAPYGGLAYCRENNPKITCRYGSIFGTDYTDANFLRLDALMRENSEKSGSCAFEEYVNTDVAADCAERGVIDGDEYTADSNDEYVEIFGRYLTPKMRDVFALMVDGYTDTQIAEKLGLRLGATSTRKRHIREVFGKHSADVVKALADYGINADGIPDRTPKRNYKTSEKQRESMARYLAKKRERKRDESTPHDAA